MLDFWFVFGIGYESLGDQSVDIFELIINPYLQITITVISKSANHFFSSSFPIQTFHHSQIAHLVTSIFNSVHNSGFPNFTHTISISNI